MTGSQALSPAVRRAIDAMALVRYCEANRIELDHPAADVYRVTVRDGSAVRVIADRPALVLARLTGPEPA